MKIQLPARKRILMTSDTLGGVWSYSMGLARSMEIHRTDFHLMTMGAPLSPAQRQEASQIKNLSLYETDFRVEWMESPWEEVDAAGKRLQQLEAEIVPDVIHLNGYAHGDLPWRAPVLIVAHSCVLSWWRAVHAQEAPAKYHLYKTRVSAGLRCAHAVVAPSSDMLLSLRINYRFAGRGKVIFNGHPFFGARREKKQPVVFAAGRLWDEAKNFAILNQIAPRLKWPVCIAGQSYRPEGGQRFFTNLNCLGCLPPERLSAHLRTAAIFAHPAYYEPFGLSILEAAQAGCALVLGDIPSLRELWADAAIFVSPDNEESVYEGISSLISSESLRGEMSARAQRRALHYSAANMAFGYQEIYRELIAGRSAAPSRSQKEAVS